MQIFDAQQQLAELMRSGQDLNARIRVEDLIRQEMFLQAYTMLETFVLLIKTRAAMLKTAKEPPLDMQEAMCSIFYASDRVRQDLDEIPAIADLLMSKFCSAFVASYDAKDFPKLIKDEYTARNFPVNPVVMGCLSLKPAPVQEKLNKLESVANKHGIAFDRERAEREMMPHNPRMPRVGNNDTGPAWVYKPQPGSNPNPPTMPSGRSTPMFSNSATTVFPSSAPIAPPPAGAPEQPAKPAESVGPPQEPSSSSPASNNMPSAVAGFFQGRPSGSDSHSLRRQQSVGKEWRSEGWDPLPPPSQQLGYDFGERLGAAETYLRAARVGSGSQDLASSERSASGGGPSHHGPMEEAAAEFEEKKEPEGDEGEAEGEGEGEGEDSIAKRLARLRGF